MRIKIVLLSLFLFSANVSWAQGMMSFEEETHDFKTIQEGEIATYEFTFTNTGDQPIEISNVKASCGCTTPYWSKGIIQPGQKGSIKASYNSKGRPGGFTKSVTVRSNAKRNVRVLYIKGFVEPSQSSMKAKTGQEFAKSKLVNKTPQSPPAIRIDKKEFDFGKVQIGELKKQRFNIYNAGKQNLVITGFDKVCDCISFGLSSSVIGPNQTGMLEISLEGRESQELGEDFILYTNDPNIPAKTIRLKANIYEDFSQKMFKDTRNTAPFGQ